MHCQLNSVVAGRSRSVDCTWHTFEAALGAHDAYVVTFGHAQGDDRTVIVTGEHFLCVSEADLREHVDSELRTSPLDDEELALRAVQLAIAPNPPPEELAITAAMLSGAVS